MLARLEPPWRRCLELSWDAYRAGSIPIGAVVVRRDSGEIVSSGRNRICDAAAPPGQVAGTVVAHAELNAIIQIRRGTVDPRLCEVYTSVEPCPLCMGAIYMSGIRSLSYACRDSWAGATGILGTTPYMSLKAIAVAGPGDPELEDVIMALNVDSMLADGYTPEGELLSSWRLSVPSGVALGLRTHSTGILRELASSGASAASVVSELCQLRERLPCT